MTHNPAAECAKCGGQVGTEHYVLATDGISGKMVTFHKRCDPCDPDLQRTHMLTLGPVRLGTTLADLT